MTDFLLFLFSGGAILSALMMVTRRNPVTAVIFLVGVFFNISGLFLLLDAHYLAAINIILYAGAIMVLFLFVIMLLNLGHVGWRDLRGPFGGMLAGAVSVAFLGVLARRLVGDGAMQPGEPAGEALRAAAGEQGVIGVVANALFGEYVVVLEVTGLLLLTAVVGTIVLARRRSS
jgi:NADH-quinone oxidoreductase subunit J